MTRLVTVALALALLGNTAAMAQGEFEGTIHYKVKIDGAIAGLVRSLLPTEQVVKLRHDGYSRRLSGGGAPQWFIHVGKDKTTYLLSEGAQTVSRLPNPEVEPQITRLEEETEIAGYNCRKYKVVLPAKQNNIEIVQYVWAAPRIKSAVHKNANDPLMGYYKAIDGFPLRVITTASMMGAEIEMSYTATHLVKETVAATEVALPAGYKTQDMQLPDSNAPGAGIR
jgi:hypothetical protein